MYGLTRGTITLIAAAAAGVLLWAAVQVVPDGDFTNRRYWTILGLIAAAGLVMALSQLLGGWTKWGWPRLSPSVFLFAFLPTLLLAGGILLAMRPAGEETGQVRGWAQDLGIEGLVGDLSQFAGVLAFTVGLVLAFCFDTSGPRTKFVGHDRDYVRDEDVHDYRQTGSTPVGTSRDTTSDRSVSEELRTRGDEERTLHARDDDRTHVVTSGTHDDTAHVDDTHRHDTGRRDTV